MIGTAAQIDSDPIAVAMVIDEADHYLTRRSSSAWAKYADAFRKISFVRFRLAILALQLLQALALIGRQTAALAAIALGLPHPLAQRLSGAAQLAGDRRDRGPLRRVLRRMLSDQANGPLSYLR